VQASSSSGSRVLVALEKNLNRDDYSHFWRSLEERGYELTFKSPRDESPSLTSFDERSFDHLVLFSPSTKTFSSDLTPQSLVRYLSLNGNILLALSPSLSEFNRDFAREFSLEFQPSDSYLIDHSHYVPSFDVPSSSSSSPHTAIALPPTDTLSKNSAIVSEETRRGAPVLYRGVGHRIVPGSPLTVEILKGTREGYSAEPRESEGAEDSIYPSEFLAGGSVGLVTGMQTLDNSRVVFAGSVELFSDRFWDASFKGVNGVEHPTSGNKAFVKDITQWAFQEKGVLRIVAATHQLSNTLESKDVYRIKDDVTYSITLQTHVSNGKSSSWSAITLPDLQLDFTMLDPHVRANLVAVESGEKHAHQQEYTVDFKIPDRHGVFKFLVDYKRAGWTFIQSSQTVSVVPFRHDEYPRFIVGAIPYYSGAASTSVAFLLFCAVWLGWKEEKVSKGEKE
ncbi:dolichyl-diphosphooligosaccharide--protein glycosyltransferase 48 kda subunit precursor, partial [Mrakia frigida]|uniref:dolichyl-diphosphooligosaccharide-protein glycotransferase n=1 Tax=Mrakia frigida TaxID=29902 RepID=UPI003FCBF4C4